MGVADEMIIGGGAATASLDQMRAYLLDAPDRLLTVGEVGDIVDAFYWLGDAADVRWDVAFAQTCHETNRYRFSNQVALVQHNPAGIGATNDGSPGLTFPDWRTGIAAYFVHLLAWCDRLDLAPAVAPDYRALDPRLPLVAEARRTKGAATTWRSLGGRWAVPGTGYGDAIARHHDAIMASPETPQALPMREAIIPATNANRPGLPMAPRWITVHETSNTNVGADAEMHRRFVANGGGSAGVSFHWVVDDREAIHLVPDDEAAWHAGDGYHGTGNRESVAIETCVNADGDWAATRRNLAILVATLMRRHGILLANVVQHNRWSGKDCPLVMRRDGLWAGTLAAVAAAYQAQDAPAGDPFADYQGNAIYELAKLMIGGADAAH